MPKITLENVSKRWGNFYGVDNLNLEIEDNSFVILLGPSGCGKTTILRMIAGLETPTIGKITIGDRVVFDSEMGINVPPDKRNVGFLFQNYALWPNMTVYDNISFGLKNQKEVFPDIDFEAMALSKKVDILSDPEEVAQLLNAFKDKQGKIDKDRALVGLIDRYGISQFTAKDIFGYKIHEMDDPGSGTRSILEDVKQKFAANKDKHRSRNTSLNERFEIVKNGEVQTSKRKLTKEEIDLRVRRVSRIVKISMFMDRYPSELSGGQQQRVAIARTLAPEPSVLFMDEPLSNLDAKLRLEMRSELQRLHFETGSTFVYVTHDQMEAMTLGTKISLLDNAVLQQYAEPLKLYKKPTNIFAADFVGNPSINLIEAQAEQDRDGDIHFDILDGEYTLTFRPEEPVNLEDWKVSQAELHKKQKEMEARRHEDKRYVEKENKTVLFEYDIPKLDQTVVIDEDEDLDYVLGVRPEFIDINPDGHIEGEVYSVMPTGMETTLRISTGNYIFTGVVFGDTTYAIGEQIRYDFSTDGIMAFYKKDGNFITLGEVVGYKKN